MIRTVSRPAVALTMLILVVAPGRADDRPHFLTRRPVDQIFRRAGAAPTALTGMYSVQDDPQLGTVTDKPPKRGPIDPEQFFSPQGPSIRPALRPPASTQNGAARADRPTTAPQTDSFFSDLRNAPSQRRANTRHELPGATRVPATGRASRVRRPAIDPNDFFSSRPINPESSAASVPRNQLDRPGRNQSSARSENVGNQNAERPRQPITPDEFFSNQPAGERISPPLAPRTTTPSTPWPANGHTPSRDRLRPDDLMPDRASGHSRRLEDPVHSPQRAGRAPDFAPNLGTPATDTLPLIPFEANPRRQRPAPTPGSPETSDDASAPGAPESDEDASAPDSGDLDAMLDEKLNEPVAPESPPVLRVSEVADNLEDLLQPALATSTEPGSAPTASSADSDPEPEETVDVLRRLDEGNAQIAEQQSWVRAQIERTQRDADTAHELFADLKNSLTRVKRKQDQSGLTPTLGLILKHQRDHMPGRRKWLKRMSDIQSQILVLDELEFSLEEQAARSDQFDRQLVEMIAPVVEANGPTAGAVRAQARQISEERRTLLHETIKDCERYAQELTILDSRCNELVDVISAYQNYIDRNVLWIRSTTPVGASDFEVVPSLLEGLGDTDLWGDIPSVVANSAQQQPMLPGFMGLLVMLRMAFGRRLKRWLRHVGSDEDGPLTLTPSLQVTGATALLAMAWPLALWFSGHLLTGTFAATTLALALGSALKTVALAWVSIELVRQTCRPGGLAHHHFGCNLQGLKPVYASLTKMMSWGLPLTGVASLVNNHADGAFSGTVGRVLFSGGLLGLAMHLRRTLCRRKTGLLLVLLGNDERRRLRQVLSLTVVAVPVLVAGLALSGYHYSGIQIAECLRDTWLLALGVFVATGLAGRVLLGIQQTLTGQPETEATGNDVDGDDTDTAEHRRAREIEISCSQVRALVRAVGVVAMLVGCWTIWSDLIPVSELLNRVELWTMTREVSAPPGEQGVTTVTQIVPVTLADLLQSLLILAITIVGARNLPGLLDTAILGRLPFDSGGRHAIATICRYVLTTVGTVFAFHAIGVNWDSVQWLVAAMTVGLGFGLQEIFANFVSGLIILLERPVRIGDFVTVGGETGHVTRIQFRATTITDLDRRELLVPNKRFITDELINWTLSDPITRVVIPVGVAYGTDTTRTHELLMEVANKHPAVLAEPEPSAVMTGFGESTLDFELRVFIPRRDEHARILHEVNTAIERAFSAAGVEMAFPQCDVHVRTVDQALSNLSVRRAA